MFPNLSVDRNKRIIIGLCLTYLFIQCLYIPFATLSVDDFWLTYHTFHFKSGLPYRDFAPYKTVMGYYILLLPMLFFQGAFNTFIYTKLFIALINTSFLIITGLWLTTFFQRRAVILSLALCAFSQFFLSYSTEIRVDILAYWFCLLSILFVFENKFFSAGLMLGFGFIISQKTLWYLFATDAALAMVFLQEMLSTRQFLSTLMHKMLRLNLAALIPIALYISAWSAVSNFHTVLHSIFYEAYIVAALDSYNDARLGFWQQVLQNNGLFCLLAPATLFMLMVQSNDDGHQNTKRLFIITLASVILFFISTYKQPFPYNISVTLPIYFILYAAFISWIMDIFNSTHLTLKVPPTFIIGFVLLYTLSIAGIVVFFDLPAAYLLICLIPWFLLTYSLTYTTLTTATHQLIAQLILLTLVFMGIVFPLVRFISLLDATNGQYQRYILHLSDNLLADGGDYIAGEPLYLNREQPIPGLVHLVVPSLLYYYTQSPKLFPVMNLSSLYLTPTSTTQMIAQWKKANVKLYINNNRFYQLPEDIRKFMATEYEHYWGSIYLYAPQIPAGENNVWIKFQGKYKLESTAAVNIDGLEIYPNQLLPLTAGNHGFQASAIFRLKLMPENIPTPLEPRFEKDTWNSVLL